MDYVVLSMEIIMMILLTEMGKDCLKVHSCSIGGKLIFIEHTFDILLVTLSYGTIVYANFLSIAHLFPVYRLVSAWDICLLMKNRSSFL